MKYKLNKKLSQERANAVVNYLKKKKNCLQNYQN